MEDRMGKDGPGDSVETCANGHHTWRPSDLDSILDSQVRSCCRHEGGLERRREVS